MEDSYETFEQNLKEWQKKVEGLFKFPIYTLLQTYVPYQAFQGPQPKIHRNQ